MKRSRNALVHGVYSSDIILPWEKSEDFHELLNGLRDEYRPVGTSECQIVFDLAVLYWKKARANRQTQVLLRQNPVGVQIVESGKRTTNGICAHLDGKRAVEKEYSDARSKKWQLLGRVLTDSTMSGKKKKRILRKVEELEQTLLAAPPREDHDLSSLVEELARDLEIPARLDGFIDRTFQRLVALKELKRLYASPVLISDTTEGRESE